jgi:hypothetical protein
MNGSDFLGKLNDQQRGPYVDGAVQLLAGVSKPRRRWRMKGRSPIGHSLTGKLRKDRKAPKGASPLAALTPGVLDAQACYMVIFTSQRD